eukprot:2824920-Alexandrium_andersonii.AAC.1
MDEPADAKTPECVMDQPIGEATMSKYTFTPLHARAHHFAVCTSFAWHTHHVCSHFSISACCKRDL